MIKPAAVLSSTVIITLLINASIYAFFNTVVSKELAILIGVSVGIAAFSMREVFD